MIRLPGPDVDPVEAARRLGGLPGRFLLHSGSDAGGVGRWSFVGAEPSRVLRVARGDDVDAFGRLAELATGAPTCETGPLPVAVGFISYDAGRRLESIGSHARDDVGAPDVWFGRHEAIWRKDATTGVSEVVGTRDAARRLHDRLSRKASPLAALELGPLASEESGALHEERIERILAYIRAGDVYQVNLARRLSARVRRGGDVLPLYERLAVRSPSPYGGLVESDTLTLVSASPELFLRVAPGSRVVETRPIKGTASRGADGIADDHAARALVADPKEQAEHLMIVDLLRNDLGRVARIGTVHVAEHARLVSLPQVHHLVSTVRAELRENVGPGALLAATFPGGSITGAPKVRAMQIIEELEPLRRGPYTGAMGYLGADGTLDLGIVIRTAVVTDDRLLLHVGGGIVADSSPAGELAETEAKAAGWRQALTMA